MKYGPVLNRSEFRPQRNENGGRSQDQNDHHVNAPGDSFAIEAVIDPRYKRAENQHWNANVVEFAERVAGPFGMADDRVEDGWETHADDSTGEKETQHHSILLAYFRTFGHQKRRPARKKHAPVSQVSIYFKCSD